MRTVILVLLVGSSLWSCFQAVEERAQPQWLMQGGSFHFNAQLGLDTTTNRPFIEAIEVRNPLTNSLVQTIVPPVIDFEWFDSSNVVLLQDVNFDGQVDIQLLNWISVNLQTSYIYWIYQPDLGQFVRDTLLDDFWNPEFLPETQRVTLEERYGDGEKRQASYQWQGKKLILMEENIIELTIDDKRYEWTKRQRVNGVLEEKTTLLDELD